jgi:ring-1,2-phenylacetyl-CoA epoxidase subunit PaaE
MKFREVQVAAVDALCDDAVAVTFDVEPQLREEFGFRAGQSLTVRRTVAGVEHRRSYSICAPAGSAPCIGVRAVPGGAVSDWLVRDVRVGDRIEVAAPSGTFTADLSMPARHVLVGAGSGITPLLSVAATALSTPGTRVLLIYLNRRSDTVMFVDELAELKDRYGARLELVHVLSREQRDVGVPSGRLTRPELRALLDALVPVGDVGHWWLCGPLPLVEAVGAVLRDLRVPATAVHRELFYVEDSPPPVVEHRDAVPSGATARVTVVLDGRATELVLPRDVPVLDAAQRVRGDLPFACKGGVCGTCRARVRHGAVRMRRNFALTDDELAAGFVLSCQSLPDSDEVELDFDAN